MVDRADVPWCLCDHLPCCSHWPRRTSDAGLCALTAQRVPAAPDSENFVPARAVKVTVVKSAQSTSNDDERERERKKSLSSNVLAALQYSSYGNGREVNEVVLFKPQA